MGFGFSKKSDMSRTHSRKQRPVYSKMKKEQENPLKRAQYEFLPKLFQIYDLWNATRHPLPLPP